MRLVDFSLTFGKSLTILSYLKLAEIMLDSSVGFCCKTLSDDVIYSCKMELSSKIDDLSVIESVSQKLLAMNSI
jgi:hypothetical protein